MTRNFINDSQKKRAYANYTFYRNAHYNKNMTMQQHTALAILSSYRHELHQFQRFNRVNKARILNFFNRLLSIMLRNAQLPELHIAVDPLFICVDSSEFDEHAEAYTELLNIKIEHYLGMIDNAYHTDYKPTGMSRRSVQFKEEVA